MKKANFILGITALSAMPALGQTASSRPNIIYILMDDLYNPQIERYAVLKRSVQFFAEVSKRSVQFSSKHKRHSNNL